MALIEINPDLKRLSGAAERIAYALEQIALRAYGIRPAPKLSTDARPSQVDDIQYSSDESTLRNELEALARPGMVAERDGDDVIEEIGDVLGTERR